MYNPFYLKLKKNKWERDWEREREKKKKRRNIISKVIIVFNIINIILY